MSPSMNGHVSLDLLVPSFPYPLRVGALRVLNWSCHTHVPHFRQVLPVNTLPFCVAMHSLKQKVQVVAVCVRKQR